NYAVPTHRLLLRRFGTALPHAPRLGARLRHAQPYSPEVGPQPDVSLPPPELANRRLPRRHESLRTGHTHTSTARRSIRLPPLLSREARVRVTVPPPRRDPLPKLACTNS